ncbi:DUF6531 domain-containing protein [uncultured Lacinutrix sp.]|uniref:DUF6531 domain-containing protein n=1 Tax=uncultured Lacinutrix sp. TaxID=574032 RepID=UPI002622EFA1|nr:DUF6531 domain-containing protein [uncultured Lacinutrix sp.]
MSEKKCVPKNVNLLCDKCPKPSPFIIKNPNTTIHGMDLGTEKDNVFGTNFQSFGACSANGGTACTPSVKEWTNLAPDVTCAGGKLLTHKSKLPCTTGSGGEISIVLEAPTPETPNAFQKMKSNMNGLVNKVTAPYNDAKQALGDSLSSAKESLGNAIGGAVDSVKKTAQEAHIALGDGIGAVVDGVKDASDDIENFAEDRFGVGNEARALMDVNKGIATIGLGALEGSAALVTGAKDLVVGVGGHLWGYTQDFSGAASKDIDTVVSASGAIYRRTRINAVLNPEDYAAAQASDKAFIKAQGEGIKKWYNNLTASDVQKLIGRGGFEVAFTLLSGGSSQIANVTQKVNTVKNSVRTTENTLQMSSDAANAAKLAKNKDGDVTINTPDDPPPPKDKNGDNNQPKDNDGTSCRADGSQVCKNDPVNVVTGAMFYSGIDFEIPGIIPIKWERVWYSDSKYKGPLGSGFHHSYNLHLKENTTTILLRLPDGRGTFFPKLSKEKNTHYNRQEKLKLTYLNNGNYELFNYNNQLTYSFEKYNTIFRLKKIFNSDLASIKFDYNGNLLIKIIDTLGKVININSNKNNLISNITISNKDEKKELVTYTYDNSKNLVGITDIMGKTLQMRYKNHLMISKTDRNGQTFFWKYDGITIGSKCIYTSGDNGVMEGFFEYFQDYTIYQNKPHGKSTFYHNNGLGIKEIDALGGIQIKEYNEQEELIKEIDEEGLETSYNYDDYGNLTEIRLPDGATYEYTYDELGRAVIANNPEGGTVVKSYKNNKLDCVIQPDGSMTTFQYNSKGLPIKVFDNLDNETFLSYDKDCNLIAMKLPDGTISKWEYNQWGQCIAAINPENHRQQFSYDALGRVTNVNLPDKNKIQLKYNNYNEVIEAIDKQRTVKFKYTALGNLLVREENGVKVRFGYNSEEELISIVNEHDEFYRFTRDLKGNIIKEEGFDGITRQFQRDKAGKVIKIERPNEKYSLYEYDLGGRISRIEHQDGTWATYNYNKDGLLIEAINSNSHVKLIRDEAGRITAENQDGHIVNSQYGELGLRTNIKSSLGADIRFNHSDLGQVISMYAKTNNSEEWQAQFKYNSLGQETERSLPGNTNSNWQYDSAGRPTRHKIKGNNKEHRDKQYNWDINDKLRSIVDTINTGSVNFGYNVFNSLAWANYENDSYDYKLPDEVGNLYRTKDKKDQEYTKSGKLLRSGNTYFDYDTEGNLTQKRTPKGTWYYFWEASGMLQKILRPDYTEVSFEYDALGRRTSKIVNHKSKINTVPDKESTIARFVWDGNVPLHEWNYNLKERPKTIINNNGHLSLDKKEPISSNLITWIFDQNTFKPAAKIVNGEYYSIITDYLGTPVEMYNNEGKKTWQVEYDIYGKIRKQIKGNPDDCPFRYQGQYEDIETGLYYNRFRYYSPEEGIYISQDPIRLAGNNPNIYAYTHDSNCWLDPFGLAPGKKRPPNGWNYGNMPKIDGFQLHHVIPKSLNDHKTLKIIGYNINKLDNLIYLPEEIDAYGDRSAHKGWTGDHAKYNKLMKSKLDRLAIEGEKNNWTKEQYKNEVDKLRLETRQGLRNGTIKCR